jgi:hypothetical protein
MQKINEITLTRDKGAFKKPTPMVYSTGTYTKMQRKILNTLIDFIQSTSENFRDITIPNSKIAKDIGHTSRNFEPLIEAVAGMSSATIQFDYLRSGKPKKGDIIWHEINLISQTIVTTGETTFVFNPDVFEYIRKPERYGLIKRAVNKSIRSGYGLALYEICVQFRDLGQTRFFSTKELRDLLGVESGQYEEFKYFNRRVIKTAVSAVNETKDIVVDVVKKTNPKKEVTHLQFIVKPYQSSIFDENFILQDRLKKYDLSPSQIERIFNDLTEKEIDDTCQALDSYIVKKSIDNVTGLAYKAFIEDGGWKSPKSKDKAAAEKARKESTWTPPA